MIRRHVRSIAIWITGLLAAVVLGGLFDVYFYTNGRFIHGWTWLGLVSAFVCLRLWLGERRDGQG